MHDALFQEEVDHRNMKVKYNKQILHKTLNKVQKKDYNVERDAHPATPAGPLAYHYLYFFKAFLRGESSLSITNQTTLYIDRSGIRISNF